MSVSHMEHRLRPERFALLLMGVSYVLPGLALLLAPRWFFAHIGPFAPFNRHYQGDLGAFVLPLGVSLLFAAWNPLKHRAILALNAACSLLHAVNHLYDALFGPVRQPWTTDLLPLWVGALLSLALCLRVTESAKGGNANEADASLR